MSDKDFLNLVVGSKIIRTKHNPSLSRKIPTGTILTVSRVAYSFGAREIVALYINPEGEKSSKVIYRSFIKNYDLYNEDALFIESLYKQGGGKNET